MRGELKSPMLSSSFDEAHLANKTLGGLDPIAEDAFLEGSKSDVSDASTHASADYSFMDEYGYSPPSFGVKKNTSYKTIDNSIIEEYLPTKSRNPKSSKKKTDFASELYSFQDSGSVSPICSIEEEEEEEEEDGDSQIGEEEVDSEGSISIGSVTAADSARVNSVGYSAGQSVDHAFTDYIVDDDSGSSLDDSISIESISSDSIGESRDLIDRPDSITKKKKKGKKLSPISKRFSNIKEEKSTIFDNKEGSLYKTPRLPRESSVPRKAVISEHESVPRSSSVPRKAVPPVDDLVLETNASSVPRKVVPPVDDLVLKKNSSSVPREAVSPVDDLVLKTNSSFFPEPVTETERDSVPRVPSSSRPTTAQSDVLMKTSKISPDDGLNGNNKDEKIINDDVETKKKKHERKKIKSKNVKQVLVSKGIKQKKQNFEKKEKKKKNLNGGEVWRMKKTNLRVKKSRVKSTKRGTSFQLSQIKVGKPGAGGSFVEKGEKVMRVCKLTSKGYITAEFPSDDPNNTPLHIACLTHYSERFILDHLLKGDSNDTRVENSDGELPIHYAVKDKQGVHREVFETLVKLNPNSLQHQNIDGSLPLHSACQAGVPSLYSLKRLIEIHPDSLIDLSDICVPIDQEELEERPGCMSLAFAELFFVDWTKKEEKPKFESGWSPLHLAAVHGADPEAIEHILEINRECMELKTSEKRTPVECAKWIVINALVSDISVKVFQNTFAAIEIMQSYEEEAKIRDVLLIKSGLAASVLDSTETFGSWWMGATDYIPDQEDGHDSLGYSVSDDDNSETREKGLTPLHRAVMNKEPPEAIRELLQDNPDSLNIKSADDRTALEWSKAAMITALLEGKPVASMKNWFLSLIVMQEYASEDSVDKKIEMEELLPRSLAVEQMNIGRDTNWIEAFKKYKFMKKLIGNKGNSALGKLIIDDNDTAVHPHEFLPPANLKHVNIRINLPAGFRRVRKAVLFHNSTFLSDVVLRRLKVTCLEIGAWDKCNQDIGWPRKLTLTGESMNIKKFTGAKRKYDYKLPKTNTDNNELHVSEEMELLEYNDFCFVLKSIKKSLDVSNGNLYETHSQLMIIDKGMNNCRLIGSMEVFFPTIRPASAWNIKNRMRFRTSDFFNALASSICEHALE